MANLVNTQAVVGEVNIEDETVVAVVEVEQPVSADLTIPTIVTEESNWRNVEAEAETLAAGSDASAVFTMLEDGVKFTFGIPQGIQGIQGNAGPMGTITSVVRTSGTGAPGTTDTYTATCSDGSTFTFNVYNGRDGLGSGDMSKSVYDPQNKNTNIFAYADAKYTKPTDGIPMDDLSEEVQSAIAEGGSGGGSNPNLLDNGWFTVNQRGATSYEWVSSDMYTFDRWYIWRTSVSESNGVVTVSHNNTNAGGFSQKFESSLSNALVGKTVTASAMLADGVIKSVTGILSDTITYLSVNLTDNISLKVSSGNIRIYAEGGTSESVSIRAIKLEYGSTSTLALDSAPDYTTELLKCQRYFARIKPVDGAIFGFGYANATTSARISIPVPTTMRTKPTVSYRTESGTNWYRVYANGTQASVSAMSVVGESTAIVTLLITTSTITANHTAVLFCNNANGYIDLSADL